MNKILVVDDDPNIRSSLSAILGNEGFEVSSAEDKNVAFNVLEKNTPDVILLDVNISSNQDGYDIARELLNSKKYGNIPVIILTSTEIVSGGEKLIDLARKFRNNPQFGYINAILQEDPEGRKTIEYKAESSGEVVSLPVADAISKPIDTDLLLDSIKMVLQ